MQPTAEGYAAVRRIDPAHAVVARRLAEKVGRDELRETLDSLIGLSTTLDALA